MLEFTNYSIQNIDDLKDFFAVCYTIIDDIYKKVALHKLQIEEIF